MSYPDSRGVLLRSRIEKRKQRTNSPELEVSEDSTRVIDS